MESIKAFIIIDKMIGTYHCFVYIIIIIISVVLVRTCQSAKLVLNMDCRYNPEKNVNEFIDELKKNSWYKSVSYFQNIDVI